MLVRSKLFVPYGNVRANDVDLWTGGSTISVRNSLTALDNTSVWLAFYVQSGGGATPNVYYIRSAVPASVTTTRSSAGVVAITFPTYGSVNYVAFAFAMGVTADTTAMISNIDRSTITATGFTVYTRSATGTLTDRYFVVVIL